MRGGQGQAALCLRYVQHAGGRYVSPVRTVRRPRGVRFSTGAHWAREARRARAAVERVAAGEALRAQVKNGTVRRTSLCRCERDAREERQHRSLLPWVR